ncbi:branched-chain amino acid ABC transporter permease [Microbacterium sp. NPDC058062]|uniref:branched-chain amino acid ABC transporter permease n=1 Tax=Microbacterium sp. NPDC058062 TaxID=3346320 RepID=UPI0036DA25F5
MNSQLLQTLVSGVAVGSTYALIALGFVLVYSATRVLNFAQGAFVLIGAYATYQLGSRFGLPFFLAVLLAAIICSGLSVLFERFVVRRIPPHDHFAAVMVTVGALFAVEAVVASIWGATPMNLGDPWGVDTVPFLGAAVAVVSIWTIAVSVVLLTATFVVFKFTKVGLAMRAAVSDPLAATANGISLSRVRLGVWAAAGAAGAIAGVLMSTGATGVSPALGIAAFAALPAMVLGGLTSPVGAIVGGLITGMVQQLAVLYQPQYLPFLGDGFPAVTPYLLLVVVLLVKPSGLFGTRTVGRF